MSEEFDPYKVLGLKYSADGALIKATYRKLARKYHPDVNPGSKAAEAKFKDVSKAYEILKSPEKKADFDLRRKQAEQRENDIKAARKLEEEQRRARGQRAAYGFYSEAEQERLRRAQSFAKSNYSYVEPQPSYVTLLPSRPRKSSAAIVFTGVLGSWALRASGGLSAGLGASGEEVNEITRFIAARSFGQALTLGIVLCIAAFVFAPVLAPITKTRHRVLLGCGGGGVLGLMLAGEALPTFLGLGLAIGFLVLGGGVGFKWPAIHQLALKGKVRAKSKLNKLKSRSKIILKQQVTLIKRSIKRRAGQVRSKLRS